jgi:hypothetical protein
MSFSYPTLTITCTCRLFYAPCPYPPVLYTLYFLIEKLHKTTHFYETLLKDVHNSKTFCQEYMDIENNFLWAIMSYVRSEIKNKRDFCYISAQLHRRGLLIK